MVHANPQIARFLFLYPSTKGAMYQSMLLFCFSTSMWLPVPSAKVPEPRPGKCVADTRELPDTVLNFIRKHPLMDSDVPHDAEGPAFYKRDVVFTKLAVDQVFTL